MQVNLFRKLNLNNFLTKNTTHNVMWQASSILDT